jgi:CheY-like chemotaxis protein
VAKTLLAVDDSVTMRKALEITFSSDDFRVITAEGSSAAMSKVGEADAIIIDTGLGGEDGYALAQKLRAQKPGAAIVLLASRYAPYDQARGKEAGADDFADKPFDTQALVDKVKKAIEARASGAGAHVGGAPAAAAGGAPYRAPAPPVAAPAPSPQPAAAASGGFGGGKATQQSLGDARAAALGGGARPPMQSSPQAAPARPAAAAAPQVSRAPVPPAPAPAPAPVHHAPAPVAAPVAHAAHAAVAGANGALAGKLAGLGLTPAQVEGVLALSREVVEQVVWEVVPTLAETLIKEEIARLTRE